MYLGSMFCICLPPEVLQIFGNSCTIIPILLFLGSISRENRVMREGKDLGRGFEHETLSFRQYSIGMNRSILILPGITESSIQRY